MSPERALNCEERNQFCHFTVERDRSFLFGSFLQPTSKPTPSQSGRKQLMFTSWHYLYPWELFLPLLRWFGRIALELAVTGLAQSVVKIWQSSSLFDLCRQLKESTSGFKVQKACLHWSNAPGSCQISSVLTEHREPLFIVGSEAAGLVSHIGAARVPLLLTGPVLGKRVSWESFLLVARLSVPFVPYSLIIML